MRIKELQNRIKTFQAKYDEISDVTGIAKDKRRLTVQKPQGVLTSNTDGGTINRKLFDRAINIHNETPNGVFSFDDIEKDLRRSEIGKGIIKYIEDEGLFITMNYDANVPTNVMGQIRGKDIEIFAANCETLEEAVDTLIHEVSHKKYNWLYTQADEINCYIMEYKHRHSEIKQEDLKKIIDFVSENYGYLPKGDFNGIGIY